MLDIWASERISVEGLDVEDIGYDIHIQPETSADIGTLRFFLKMLRLDQIAILLIRTSLRRVRVTPTPRNLQRCSMENLRKVWRTALSISLAFLSGLLGLYGMTMEA